MLYELAGGLLNWLVYANSPPMCGGLFTAAPTPAQLEHFWQESDLVHLPSLAAAIRATPSPLMNDIYDMEPLAAAGAAEEAAWVAWGGRGLLLGDAAHPTSPHRGMGSNMAVEDAHVLVSLLYADGVTVEEAAVAYAKIRAPLTARVVRHSRALGRLKNSLDGQVEHGHRRGDEKTASWASIGSETFAALAEVEEWGAVADLAGLVQQQLAALRSVPL